MPTDPARLTEELDERNLALLGSWVSVFLHDRSRHEEGIADAVRTAKLLAKVGGLDNVIVLGFDPYGVPVRTQKAGRITEAEAMTPEQWDALIDGSMKIAKAVKEETGLRTVAHHHIGTFVETPEETAHLLANTDPDLLGAISSEESQRIQIWASELVEGSQPWAIPPSIGVDEIFESERTLIARERIMSAEPDADGEHDVGLDDEHRHDDDERRCGYNGDRSLLLAAPGVARAAHRTLWHIMACVRGSLVSHAMHGSRFGAASFWQRASVLHAASNLWLDGALFCFDRGLYMKI